MPNSVSLPATTKIAPKRTSVRLLQPEDYPQWDDFVMRHAHGTPFHLVAWKNTIQELFRYEPFYLVAGDADGIEGILPIFLVKNPIIGKILISSPFAVYGGILARSDEARQALYRRVKEIGIENKVDYIELRNAYPEQCVGIPNVSRYVTFSKELQADENALLTSLPGKTRNKVRKALKEGFTAHYRVSDPRNFFLLYCKIMRRHGTPVFPLKFFQSLLKNFAEMADIREVRLNGKPMAVSLNFFFRDNMHTYYGATDPRFKSTDANSFMYFDSLRWAGQNGYRTFDFGRSKRGTGPFEFKRHWNTEMRELPYEVVLIGRKDLPNFSPSNPRFAMAIRLWRKLPLALTQALGPSLVRLFP